MTNRATKYSFVVTSVIHKQYNIYIISTYLRRMTYTKSNKFEKQIHILIEMFVSLVLTDIFLKKSRGNYISNIYRVRNNNSLGNRLFFYKIIIEKNFIQITSILDNV